MSLLWQHPHDYASQGSPQQRIVAHIHPHLSTQRRLSSLAISLSSILLVGVVVESRAANLLSAPGVMVGPGYGCATRVA